MDNATEECHATYKSLVPLLGTGEGLAVDMFTVRSPSSSKLSIQLGHKVKTVSTISSNKAFRIGVYICVYFHKHRLLYFDEA